MAQEVSYGTFKGVNMVEVDNKNFDETVKIGTVLVDFWAPWCAPCKVLHPHLDAISKENTELKILLVNVEDFPDLAEQLEVRSVPTLILFKDGVELKRRAGAASKTLLDNFIVVNS